VAQWSAGVSRSRSGTLGELFAGEVDFRAPDPKRTWEASDPQGVLEIVFGHWLEETDRIQALDAVQTDAVAEGERLLYRFAVRNPEGRFLVEQQATWVAPREPWRVTGALQHGSQNDHDDGDRGDHGDRVEQEAKRLGL
jgi:hypothetical protein